MQRECCLLLTIVRALDLPCSGRKERMAFADSFMPAYHFRLLYASSAMMYPIRGALRHVYGGAWEVRPHAILSSMLLRNQQPLAIQRPHFPMVWIISSH